MTSNLPLTTPARAGLAQVFLLERDAGLLCRILGLYAARGLDVLRADYAYAAQHVMSLHVTADAGELPAEDAAEVLRVLVEKAATFGGVIAAADNPG